MSDITAIYFHEDDYLGYEDLTLPLGQTFAGYSKAFFCESCGRVYGKRVITTLGKPHPYATWGGLCKNCSPADVSWPQAYAHSISGGLPFFFQYLNPPLDAVRHQLEMELLTYDLRTNQANPTFHPSGS